VIVVVSDLHFEEEAADNIPGHGTIQPVLYSRNLPASAFTSFIVHLANEARRNQAKRLDLVFAGDIFDVHRTSLWFKDNPAELRPYVASRDIRGELEQRLAQILTGIQAEHEVQAALAAFRLLAQGSYFYGQEVDFPVPVTLHYLPGNHDRELNATPALRAAVRQALGMAEGASLFPHSLLFPEAKVLIRHGHEYDRYNFSLDLTGDEPIPSQLPAPAYDDPAFGDFVTIDIASRLPSLFRRFHGDDKIVEDVTLRTIYLRLLEFDDLRPQRAMLNFLLSMPQTIAEPAVIWSAIEPAIYNLLEEIHDHPFLETWLHRMDKKWQLDVVDLVQASLDLQSWRVAGIPFGLAQFIANSVITSDRLRPPAVTFAAREEAVASAEAWFVVAGHTHRPAVELLAADASGERYYVDTGTWRNQLPSTADFKAFGRLRTLTYVIFYGPDEDVGRHRLDGKSVSFDFWSGVTQRR
jgi:UDP-2,3-diacylglucosamine pyrophosphatase LpxH